MTSRKKWGERCQALECGRARYLPSLIALLIMRQLTKDRLYIILELTSREPEVSLHGQLPIHWLYFQPSNGVCLACEIIIHGIILMANAHAMLYNICNHYK